MNVLIQELIVDDNLSFVPVLVVVDPEAIALGRAFFERVQYGCVASGTEKEDP